MYFDLLSRARYTCPNLPRPKGLPTSKSLIDQLLISKLPFGSILDLWPALCDSDISSTYCSFFLDSCDGVSDASTIFTSSFFALIGPTIEDGTFLVDSLSFLFVSINLNADPFCYCETGLGIVLFGWNFEKDDEDFKNDRY